ncbi:MAG: NnrU family protein [Nitratireductor sp.]
MFWLLLGLVVFHGLHSLRMLAPNWRQARITQMGEDKWKGLFSLLSIASVALIVWGYSIVRATEEVVYVPFAWGASANIILMFFVFCLIPFNLRSNRLSKITKHPFAIAMLLWSVGHLLANGDLASVILFGSFLVWVVFYLALVRKREDTPNPHAPLWQDIGAVLFSLAIYVFFICKAHAWLFGVSPIG